ncbi:OLC1v1030721C1 [Oldenlandia corymbosa var. corymbosa]|nr:OLC1v1030721C1 [Oldenlandia corymbosa var. corymbosa]
MATKAKESHPIKERRGISLSQKKSPSVSRNVSPTRKKDSNSLSSSSGKGIPNYLKPTISSGPDPSKHPAKKVSSTTDNLNKTTVNARRRSLDKPMQASHLQKTRISPTPKEKSIRHASSFHASRTTTMTSQKLLSDRLRGSKVSSKDSLKEIHSLHEKPVSVKKMCNTSDKKIQEFDDQGIETLEEAQKTCPNDNEEEVNVHQVVDQDHDVMNLEPGDVDSSHVIGGDEEVLNDVGGYNSVSEASLAFANENHALKDHTEEYDEVKKDEVHDMGVVESSIVSKHQDEDVDHDKIDEVHGNLQGEEPTSDKSEDGNICGAEKFNDDHKGKLEQGSDTEVGDYEARGEPAEELTNVQKLDQDKEEDEEQENNVTCDVIESTENKLDDVSEEEVKKDVDKIITKPEVVQGKRDSAVVSNDVIEETANKLREQRKNKVRALAGAFETVISLQESK